MNPSPYQRRSLGGKLPQFETEMRRCVQPPSDPWKVLAREPIRESLLTTRTADTQIQVTCPDARLVTVIDIAWVPQWLSASGVVAAPVFPTPPTMHLAATLDLGAGPQPSEDLFGTAAAQLPFLSAGLWGWSYSPTEEVEGLLVEAHLVGPQDFGHTEVGEWRARARWTSLHPMDEKDWRDAIGRCSIHVAREGQRLV